ncbi:hypothetical protein D9611_009759 [Ephemerocybe angulata]|uniref:Uncharacterized protein n=1 Tax=Ephemerocybe angulata TaxID=980116 RepID=A0A8H5CCX1_9AGAR|nr:hypothetical protein D9611_009759 [Tulosesus angulatus]
MLGLVVLAHRKLIHRLATSQQATQELVTSSLRLEVQAQLTLDLASLTCHRARFQRYATFGTQAFGHRSTPSERQSHPVSNQLIFPKTATNTPPVTTIAQHAEHISISSHAASSTSAMDPRFNLDRRTLENGFLQPTRRTYSGLGSVPIAINRPLNPIFRTPKNQIYTFSGVSLSLAATSSSTSLGQASLARRYCHPSPSTSPLGRHMTGAQCYEGLLRTHFPDLQKSKNPSHHPLQPAGNENQPTESQEGDGAWDWSWDSHIIRTDAAKRTTSLGSECEHERMSAAGLGGTEEMEISMCESVIETTPEGLAEPQMRFSETSQHFQGLRAQKRALSQNTTISAEYLHIYSTKGKKTRKGQQHRTTTPESFHIDGVSLTTQSASCRYHPIPRPAGSTGRTYALTHAPLAPHYLVALVIVVQFCRMPEEPSQLFPRIGNVVLKSCWRLTGFAAYLNSRARYDRIHPQRPLLWPYHGSSHLVLQAIASFNLRNRR